MGAIAVQTNDEKVFTAIIAVLATLAVVLITIRACNWASTSLRGHD
jgi:hypothetical protein